jgi:hypothetical protein
MGFGFEISCILLWAGWHALHGKVAHKLRPEHFFHKVHAYFE